ncbi:MAG: 4-(cytidine 5'-diphospho)-2-C-methyl-D-erythritol kinase [Ancrocorticia populi]|uniref:4-(cytidine 5'-diphospho)-2-C-methyl-D-erythritol kinase n=1 Tax=Ancrocorticia populi TaxID=2175228 RepID=UPI003F930A51
MHKVFATAPGKVNLALRVGPPRTDSFHPLDTVFEAVDVYESVSATFDRSEISVTMSGKGQDLPTDEQNLAVKAAMALRASFGGSDGVHLEIDKRIPVAGGMAGGSADAAATLVACNELWELEASADELLEIAASIGSDVPFALMGGLAHGVGRGERLVPINADVHHYWVMITAPDGLSTPAVFGEFDQIMGYRPVPEALVPDTRDLQRALAAGNTSEIASLLINDLEEPAFSLRPGLRALYKAVKSRGMAAILSGSGPTVAVLAESKGAADQLAKELATEHPDAGILRANGPVAGARVTEVI